MIICPECHREQKCGCSYCKKKDPDNTARLIFEKDLASCYHCGHTAHIDWWFEDEITPAESIEWEGI